MLSRRCVLSAPVALACGCLLQVAAAQVAPIAVTGFNRDIVVEAGAAAPFSSAAMSFDTFNNWALYERGLAGSTKGLPPGAGVFASVSDPTTLFQLQPYTGLNALFLDVSAPSGTLTFAPAARVPYDSIAILASSSNQGGTGNVVINFTDGTSTGALGFNAQDWFNTTTNNALNNLGRAGLTSSNIDDASTGNPRVYQTIINLAAIGFNTRSVQSITFTKPVVGGAAQNTVILAVSGQRAVTALTAVSASGWNRDVVVEASATTPFTGFAQPFDVTNNFAWYERGLPGSTKGLPTGGAFTSVSNPNIQGQLQPYNAPNALFLDAAGTTGSLAFSPASQRPYEFLAVFASSANGGGTGTLIVNFADGSSSPTLAFNAQDWFNVTTNNGLNDLGRVNLGTAVFDDRVGNPRIYQTIIDLASLGLSGRTVTGITFTKPTASAATIIVAVSGQGVAGATGACTFPDGTCSVLPQANCTGTFQGNNSTCPPTGACIAPNGDCVVRFQANCTFTGGTYQGNNSACPSPGACIASGGSCTQLNSFQCAFQSGNFLGAGTPCPSPAGCCVGGGCVLLNTFQCQAQGGTFQGDGSTCSVTYPGGITASAAALEDISATGTELAWTTGTNDDGYAQVNIGFTFPFFGNSYTTAFVGTNGLITFDTGSTAFTNACPAPNTAAPNNAIYPAWDDYHVGTATFAHPGRVYTEARSNPTRLIVQWNRVGQYNTGNVPTDENTFEAILYPSGNIDFRYGTITAQVACDVTVGIEDSTGAAGLNFDNTALGTGNTALSIAAQGPCPTTPTTGACCAGSSCSATTQAACSGPNTAFAGAGTTCNAPGNNTQPCCKADYNHSGSITVQDIFDFLAGYFTQAPGADVNNSGAVTVQDIFDFLSAYFAGGC